MGNQIIAMKGFLKKFLPKAVLNGLRYRHVDLYDYHVLPKKDITYSNDLLYTYHNADFQKEARFAEAYRLCKEIGGPLLAGYDIQWRVHVLCWAAAHGARLEGDFVDCGVYTGFCTRAVMHYVDFASLGRKYYLMDTFQGLDEKYSTAYELERNTKLGYASTVNLYDRVRDTFKDFNVSFVKGPIPETLSQATPEKVAFLSIDMNSAAPEVAAMEHFWPRMVSGAMIVLDDYGYPGCLNQKLAHDEWARSKGVEVLSLPTCQGLIIKP
jgi:O-methyltransferase